ncbi:MAG TPA: serine/threonine-protein kinase [Longimicrobiales bacterium]
MSRGDPSPGDWARIEALFGAAAGLPPDERRALLDREAADPAVRAEVESLLAARERDPDFLELRPPWLPPSPDDAAPDPPVPERIGPYRIVRLLGRGGMGRVYLAEHEAAGFRRHVALKLVRRGLDTDDVLRRFHAERRILASLDHPNIARLFDVGATDDGLPYLVMEYVEGTDVLDHCRTLAVPDRLALFRAICAAVHHAHRSLIVHRDLKPGNILVTADGVPKLLDFGIAKILDPEGGAGHTTRVGERLLTPRYAAPEQLRGERVTTACDVWALGVLLYEMLAGRHPFAGDGADSHEEVRRRILDHEPPPPSALAERPLRRALAGDLDTITLEALRKEPGQRYASVAALADDVRRHLEGLPVEARPATLGYRLGTFVRRNRAAVAGAATAFLLLAGFSGVTAVQARRLRIASERIAAERDKAFEVRTFLLETFGITGPGAQGADTIAVRTLLDRRAATLDDAFSADPALRAEIRGVLAEAYDQLGLHAEALRLARRALDEKRALYGDVHPDVAAALGLLGWTLRQHGDLEAADSTLREAVRVGRAAFPPEGDARLARALNDLGVVREARGDYDEAAALYRASLEMRRRLLGDGHVGVAVTTSNLAVVLYRQGDLDGAAAMAADAVETFRRALGDDHQRTLIALGNLAVFNGMREDHQGAAEAWDRILRRHRRVLGERHAQTAYAMMMRANHLARLGRAADAEPLAREALAIHREVLGARHERTARSLRVLGDIERALGRPDSALARFDEALGIARAALGDAHQEVAILQLRIARAHDALGAAVEADAAYREAVRVFTRALGAGHYLTADAALSRLEFLAARGRTAEATPLAAGIAPVIDSLAPAFPRLRERLTALRRRLDGGR